MKSKLLFILICNLIICNLQFSQNITNTLGSTGQFTIKDAGTNYLTLSQSTGQVNILKTLRLENTTSSTTGVIFKGVDRFLHAYGNNNLFLGINAGNFSMTGYHNSAFGVESLFSNTTGFLNSAFGSYSLNSNRTGYHNSAFGVQSLYSNTTSSDNSAFGYYSLLSNSTGSLNSAFGSQSLTLNISGFENSAFGYYSLYSNITGSHNSAFGVQSLSRNTTGYHNSAFGNLSLFNNTTGFENSAFGDYSLLSNTTGSHNSAFGTNSLYNGYTGYDNSAFGDYSIYYNYSGYENSAFGVYSLFNNYSGYHNSAFGVQAGSTIDNGSNLLCLGYNAQPTFGSATNQITLGNNQITSLRCNVTTITSLSDMRDKKNISDLTLGIDFLMKIKPRLFNWDKREWYDNNISDGSRMKEEPTAGFIAQELDEAQTLQKAEWLNLVLKDNPEKWEATPGNLLPVMVKAIQELKAENDELKEKLGKIEELQNILASEIKKLKDDKFENSKVSEVTSK